MSRYPKVQDREFAARFGEVLREVSFRTDPVVGDPEWTCIRRGVERIQTSLGVLADRDEARLHISMGIACAESTDDPRSFMESVLGQKLLFLIDYDFFSDQWSTNGLMHQLEAQYPRN